MLHISPSQDQFESELQLTQLRHLVTSRAAAATLAETYTGYAPLRYDPSTRLPHPGHTPTQRINARSTTTCQLRLAGLGSYLASSGPRNWPV
jgi:hypothetical protein